ncbi:hypothetical protein [Pseudomonas putida]|uniref:hypothetical protein n=1 Tax=Pseudomonas putida TaxID=303 RepID=UPI001268EDFC|nr:hypothetical protein [Pseudomonas putida]
MSPDISTISEQRAENCRAVGSYSLVTVINNPIINPGETITIDQYISGYGLGSGVKVVHYPSSDVFDVKNSYVSFNPKFNGDDPITWGGIQGQPDETGGTLIMGPMYRTGSGELVTFCDADANSNRNSIITERKLGEKPPFHYLFKTKNTAKPGPYKISFVFTYFNGENWQSSTETVEFKIQNYFEKYNTVISILAAAALITTIFSDGVIPTTSSLWNFAKEVPSEIAFATASIFLIGVNELLAYSPRVGGYFASR